MNYLKSELKEIEVKYNTTGINKAKITGSEDAEKILRGLFPIDLEYRECMTVLYLNRANNTIGHFIASLGGLSGTVCDAKMIFQVALKVNASALILCHNHPSGNTNPSRADENLTEKIKEAGKLLDIELIDHLILTEDSSYSFANEGKI